MGKTIMVTEKMISQLIGCEDVVVVTAPASRMDMATIYSEIFIYGFQSNNIRDLKPHYKIWAKIFLGYIFHRKPSNSPDYINNEQLYLLYCIGQNLKVDLPHHLFIHLWTHVKETRETTKTKNLKIRDWIPMGRLIYDILTENGLVAHLTDAGQTDELKAIVGKSLDGKSLQRMKIVEKLQSEPVQVDSEIVRTRRVPVEDFPLFIAEEPREALLAFIASCLSDGIPLPPDLMEQASQPAPEFIEKKRRKKRKASEDDSSKKVSKRHKKKGTSSSAIPTFLESVTAVPTSHPTPSEPQQPTPSEQNPPSPQQLSDFVTDIDSTIPEPNSPPPEPTHISETSTPTQPDIANPPSPSVPNPDTTSFTSHTSIPLTPSFHNHHQSLSVEVPSPEHPDHIIPIGSEILNVTPLIIVHPLPSSPSRTSSSIHSTAATPPHNSPNHPYHIPSPVSSPEISLSNLPSSFSEPPPYVKLLLSFIEA